MRNENRNVFNEFASVRMNTTSHGFRKIFRFAFGMAICIGTQFGKTAVAQATSNDISDDLQVLAKQLSVVIDTQDARSPVKTTYGDITYKPGSSDAIKNYTPLLVSEMSLYPPQLIKKVNLKRIVLCEQLAYVGQFRNAAPDFEHDTLYLEIKRGEHNTNYLRKVIHHDFYHMIDYRDDWQVYSDPEWAKLNANNFKYGTGGQNAQSDPNTSVFTDKYPGFLNHYSTTGIEEDKAEVYCNMLVEADIIDKYTARDPIMKAKVKRMKQLMHRFCAEANEDFWEAGRELKRSRHGDSGS